MILNYVQVALRHFFSQRFYSFINIIGLASGLICTLFIMLWVHDEITKDQFHNDSERIFHVVSNLGSIGSDTITWTITPGPLADAIRDKVSGVEYVARTMNNGPQLFEYGEKSFLEKGLYADPDFFKIFSFNILRGNVDVQPADKSWAAISQSMANRLFGSEDPLGKHVRVSENQDLMVIAVFEDVPASSSIKFEYMIPMEIYRSIQDTGFNWRNYNHPLYLKLTDESKAGEVSRQINAIQNNTLKAGEIDEVTFYLQKFQEYYLNSNYVNGRPDGGRMQFVQIFSVVAIFILIIACINFMNMATARAVSRAKEVGIRKVVGAQRLSLILQFVGESILISMFAMIVAITVVLLLLPMFNGIVSKQIVFDVTQPLFFSSILAVTVITGLLAGAYPAFFLSAFQPGAVLKGTLSANFSGSGLRRILVVFQFSLTVILIASAMVIYDQVIFIRNKDVGYERESIITFSSRGQLYNNFDAFRNDALQNPGVEMISRANTSLVQVNNQNASVTWPGKPADSKQFFRTVPVDFNLTETMGLKLVQGRFFSPEFNDTLNIVLTERAVEAMGLTNPVGQRITQWGSEGTIVGVVKDFHSQSMHAAIDPVILVCNPSWCGRVFVKLKGSDHSGTIAGIESSFKKFNPQYPFEYTFIDDDFEKLYQSEKVTSSLALGFTIMAIIISGLGLLGLSAFTAERRRKEIGIRKTMGASVSNIVVMMSGGFMRLCLAAIAIGCPIAYFLMGSFLEGFAYHTNLNWKIFALTSIAVIAASQITVIFQIVKAAIANPVDALRNE